MSVQKQSETRFVELMAELFQMDEAVSLDFGFYRIIRRHNREVREFLGEVILEDGHKALRNGRLSELLEAALASTDAESGAEDKYRIAELEKQLSLKPGMNLQERERRHDSGH